MKTRLVALAAVTLLVVTSSVSAQQKPWDAPAFSADPKALVAAAQGVEAGDFALVRLLDESQYVIDADGATHSITRTMEYVVAEAGVENVSEVRAHWQPWHSDRPTLDARVITKDGSVHRLDPSAIVEAPAGDEGDIFSDGRVLRAPLPAVAAGSVIETVITQRTRSPIGGAGTAVHYVFGDYLPTERTRIVLDAPLTFTPRVVNKSGVEPKIEEKDGRRRAVYEAARIEGVRERDYQVPYDVEVWPYLAFSTGTSWQEIAAGYAAIVDRQIADADLQKLVRNTVGNTTDRKEVVAKLLAAIQKDIRYAGVEIGEGSIVPRTPRQVFANKYGDCKDKASLLVAMLRIAGFPAHVALLNAGSGFDVLPELPSLAYFNHAIAVVDGDPAIWVDPTDVYARAGELPLGDQGRLALIARPETTTLTKTPELPSTASVYRERRTFHLPEEGKARVVEVSEPSTASEASMRRWVSGLDAKSLRESLEEYVQSAYVTDKKLTRFEHGDPNDLSKPFRLTLEVAESDSGIVVNGDGAVAISLAALPQNVPNALRDWEEPAPDQNPDDAPKKREHEFLFPQPEVREWVYRIIPAPGYVPRTLPANETKKLGTATFTQELKAEADNSVTATFRFDSGKRRLSVAEFDESRVAITKFLTNNVVTIGFDLVGQAKLNAGDVRGALDEFRRLTALHPKEAQHHIEVARALLAGGLGDAARREIDRAIAIEPKNALAHQTRGSILLNDSLGRPYRKGFDLKGAIASLRKAKELDPKKLEIRTALSTALSYGEDGYRFGRGARLTEAVDEVLAMAKDLGEEAQSMQPELTLLYAHLGRFEDLRALAPTLQDTTQRDLARIIATAAIDGTEAAVQELGAYDVQKRRSYASGVAQLLMQVRLYPQAAALMDLATQGTPAAAQQRQFIDLMRKMQRIEDRPKDDGPRGVLPVLFRALLYNDRELLVQIFPAEYLTGRENEDDLTKMDLRAPENLAPAMFLDLLDTMMQVQQEGDDATGYRLRIRMLGASLDDDQSMLVRRENGRWVVRGASKGEALTGDTVLSMVNNGEVEAARKWLNWTRDDVKGGTADDPLEGEPFAALWPKSKTAATEDEIRVAAASLMNDKTVAKKSEPVLVAARETLASDAAKAAVDLALARIYETNRQWPRMLKATTRLIASHPDSATAFSKHMDALLANGRAAEAAALAGQRLERLPGDRDAVRALGSSAAEKGDYESAQKYALQIVEELRAKNEDLIHAGWVALFTGKDLDRAIVHAQKAAEDKKEKGASLRTLAALYAETGRSVEARTALLQAIDQVNVSFLRDHDWYVLGRIAENYGVDDYAISAYGKVSKEHGRAATVNELAARRLAKLTKK